MFEEQSQKLYLSVIENINNLFSKKPFLCSLIISVLVSLAVFLVSLDLNRGEAKVEISQTAQTAGNSNQTGGDFGKNVVNNIVVDLSGAVKKPGVYTLPSGSRLDDLLGLGGGFVSEVSALWVSKNLNLSQNLSDGEKVYIPFEWDIVGLEENGGTESAKALSLGIIGGSQQAGLMADLLQDMGVGVTPPDTYSSTTTVESSSSSQGTESSKINVNTASVTELDKLPGIGPAYAGRMIENRPYTSLDNFKEQSGLSANLAESLKDLISF